MGAQTKRANTAPYSRQFWNSRPLFRRARHRGADRIPEEFEVGNGARDSVEAHWALVAVGTLRLSGGFRLWRSYRGFDEPVRHLEPLEVHLRWNSNRGGVWSSAGLWRDRALVRNRLVLRRAGLRRRAPDGLARHAGELLSRRVVHRSRRIRNPAWPGTRSRRSLSVLAYGASFAPCFLWPRV